jgi:probable HAF family extracellular repeat protein
MRLNKYIFLLLVFSAFPMSVCAEPFFYPIGGLPGGTFDSQSRALSVDGSCVVGLSWTDAGLQAFRWTAGQGMIGLGLLAPGDDSSAALGTSSQGTFVVGMSGAQAFRWTAETGMEPVGCLPGFVEGAAVGVSADGGAIAGRSWDPDQPGVLGSFLWTESQGMIDIGDLPGGAVYAEARGISADGRTVVGRSSSPYGRQAFRWTAESGMQVIDLPTRGATGVATAVSGDGHYVLGQTGDGSGWLTDAFLWSEETGMVQLGSVPGVDCVVPLDLADDGKTIVGYLLSVLHYDMTPFIWDPDHGIRLLETVLTDEYGLDLTGWDLKWANGSSADGRIIAGYGTNPDGNTEAWIAGIPEPGSASIIITAAIALLVARMRRSG